MPRPGRRRRALLLVLGAGAAALAGWSFGIEPQLIEVTRSEVCVPVPASIRVAHLSDLHTRGLGRRERHLLALLEREQPDLIVVSGDTRTDGGSYEECRAVLSRLQAPLGVYVVRGNWENWHPLRDWDGYFASCGVELLNNRAVELVAGVWLVGFDDMCSGAPRARALAAIPPGAVRLALFHAPAWFDKIAGRVDVAFAGHTHGGQVRIPFVPPFWLPAATSGYLAGWYERLGSRMYVSRGIGTSLLPVRLRCRPELAMITLTPDGAG